MKQPHTVDNSECIPVISDECVFTWELLSNTSQQIYMQIINQFRNRDERQTQLYHEQATNVRGFCVKLTKGKRILVKHTKRGKILRVQFNENRYLYLSSCVTSSHRSCLKRKRILFYI